MTTKTFDSTISELLQDNSVEFLDPKENPIATIPNESMSSRKSEDTPLFDFNATHNGIQCIESLKPECRGTERQFWFTAKMLATVFDCADPKTVRSRIETLVNTWDLDEGKNFLSLNVPNHTGNGAVKTTLYDLTVFNKLAMTFIDNPRAVEMRKAFNDVLVKHETQAQPTIYDYARALIAEKERSDALEAQNKALTAERDEAIRTKAMIGSKREATAMATASAKSRECKKLTTENELLKQDYITNPTFCKQLLAQNLVVYAESTLKTKCSKALQELTALMEKPTLTWNEWSDKAGKEVQRVAYHKDVCAELKQRIIDNPKYLKRFK